MPDINGKTLLVGLGGFEKKQVRALADFCRA